MEQIKNVSGWKFDTFWTKMLDTFPSFDLDKPAADEVGRIMFMIKNIIEEQTKECCHE